MDIGIGSSYPASSLSNFAPHPFVIDGVHCNSMEGFLQSLKFKSVEVQKQVCLLVGREAKFRGKYKKWWRNQTLYWGGRPYYRNSEPYQLLLDRAYNALAKNESFIRALKATGDSVLTHNMGRTNINETILTKTEFISRLNRIRNEINK